METVCVDFGVLGLAHSLGVGPLRPSSEDVRNTDETIRPRRPEQANRIARCRNFGRHDQVGLRTCLNDSAQGEAGESGDLAEVDRHENRVLAESGTTAVTGINRKDDCQTVRKLTAKQLVRRILKRTITGVDKKQGNTWI